MIKPKYGVMSMAQIRSLNWNGFKVASTFSGAGGSCTGYRMAGFKIAYANEFIPAARKTYRANHGTSILDPRDIRTVQPEQVLELLGMGKGELDLFDGSPPCSSFSTVGKREKGWGQVKKYSDTEQRTDDLFFEYARLVRGIQPKVFIAENVSGLVKGTAKGYFLRILAALEHCGYNVSARLLDAQWLGVPQTRQRIIFMGVRKDLKLAPVFPRPIPYRYDLRDALEGVPDGPTRWTPSDSISAYLYHRTKRGCQFSGAALLYMGKKDSWHSHVRLAWDKPCYTVLQAGQQSYHPDECRPLSIPELKRVCSFPDDYVLTGAFHHQWERCGRSVPPVMMKTIAETVRDKILSRL